MAKKRTKTRKGETGINLKQALEEYSQAISQARLRAVAFGTRLVELLKKVIPDIEYTIGWAEAGVDTICLWSKSHQDANGSFLDDSILFLDEVISDVLVLERYDFYIDTPFAVYITPEEGEKIKVLLAREWLQ